MKDFKDCRLYAFIDTAYLDGRDPAEVARQLCDGGAEIIQLRAKDSDPATVRRLAMTLIPILAASKVWFVLNDHWRLGLEIGAPCLHLGQEDFFDAGHQSLAELRNPGGATPAIGLSSHAPAQAERAVAAGADYVAVGPVFATDTKPGRTPVTLEYVRWSASHLSVPWFAIGGIHLGNLDEVMAAGATRVCVVSALLRARDVSAACAEFRRRLS